MSFAIDTQCLLCHLRRNLEVVKPLGTEEQAMEFARDMMRLYLEAPKDVSSPWFNPQTADLMLTSIITDPHQLLVALALSDFEVIAETLSVATEHDACHIVAHQALDIGCNPSVRRKMAKCNYFNEVLCGLLELAESDSMVGSRLVPVFDEALAVCKELRISKALKRKLKEYTEMKLETDGFAIGRRDADGKIRVKTAAWVNKMVETKLTQTAVDPRKDEGENDA